MSRYLGVNGLKSNSADGLWHSLRPISRNRWIGILRSIWAAYCKCRRSDFERMVYQRISRTAREHSTSLGVFGWLIYSGRAWVRENKSQSVAESYWNETAHQGQSWTVSAWMMKVSAVASYTQLNKLAPHRVKVCTGWHPNLGLAGLRVVPGKPISVLPMIFFFISIMNPNIFGKINGQMRMKITARTRTRFARLITVPECKISWGSAVFRGNFITPKKIHGPVKVTTPYHGEEGRTRTKLCSSIQKQGQVCQFTKKPSCLPMNFHSVFR